MAERIKDGCNTCTEESASIKGRFARQAGLRDKKDMANKPWLSRNKVPVARSFEASGEAIP